MAVLFWMVFFLLEQACSQDYQQWSFEYLFKIEVNNDPYFQLDSIFTYVDNPFNASVFKSGTFSLKDSTQSYSVQLNYGCVSCGIDGFRYPPTVLIQLFISSKEYGDKQTFSIFIPVSFDSILEPKVNFGWNVHDLGIIDLKQFLHEPERLVGIHLTSNGKVSFYKKDEYTFPATARLTLLKSG